MHPWILETFPQFLEALRNLENIDLMIKLRRSLKMKKMGEKQVYLKEIEL